MSNYAKYKDLGAGDDSSKNIGKPSPQQPVMMQQKPWMMQQQAGGMQQPGMMQQQAGGMQQQQSVVVELQSLEHKKHFINTHQVCVVKVHADWCQPCKAIAPRYAQMAQKYNRPGVCALISENADLNLSNVKGVPTHQFFKNGQYINADIVGADIASVEKRIIELLSSP